MIDRTHLMLSILVHTIDFRPRGRVGAGESLWVLIPHIQVDGSETFCKRPRVESVIVCTMFADVRAGSTQYGIRGHLHGYLLNTVRTQGILDLLHVLRTTRVSGSRNEEFIFRLHCDDGTVGVLTTRSVFKYKVKVR